MTTKRARREVPASLHGVRVLVVDPDPRTAGETEAALRAAEAEPRLASDAESALLLVNTFAPHVVIVELVLPRMSGLVLAQQLTATGGSAPPLVIGVSFIADANAKRMAREAGCAAYLQRPLFPAPLVRLIVGQLRGDA